MTEYTITGIRYQMGDHLTYEEQTVRAEQFVAGLERGRQVVLVAEPENAMDANAVAVYIDYERIGYVSREETGEVRALLDEEGLCDGVVERTDGHITLFVSVPGAPERMPSLPPKPRVLPPSPLGEGVRMPFTKAESALQLIATRLMRMEVDKEHFEEIVRASERYAMHLRSSVCHEDNFWLNRIAKKLHVVCGRCRQWGVSEEDAAKLEAIYNNVRGAVGDMHREAEHWPERVFEAHLGRLREDGRVNGHLYQKYCDAFLDKKPFAEADKERVFAEYRRLLGWLGGMKWSELRNPKDLRAMGAKVSYLRLSRQELYDLYSVLLLLEQLDAVMDWELMRQEEIVAKLTPIFYGSEDEARTFLVGIRGMKPVQITERVNQLVEGRKISGLSKKHDLWAVLHGCDIYKPTESNWNQQVK